MLRIAIMLALHNNPEQANVFIGQCLQYKGAEVFIHVDCKALHIIEKLRKDSRVHIIDKHYDVQWGDITQVKYVLALMNFISDYEMNCLSGETFDYISIHSGSDMFVRRIVEFISFLEQDHKFAYLDCHKLPWKDWQYGGGLGRIALYWPAIFRRRLKRPSFTHFCRALYGRLYGWGIIKGRRIPEDIQFWGKSAWYTISGECMSRCLNYLNQNPSFLTFFENTLCPDEIFFDTLICLVGEEENIQKHDNLMYDDMIVHDRKNVGSPKTMTMEDIETIEQSGAFFARKFDTNVDSRVVSYFLEYTS